MSTKVFVIGHKNPDTDSICSAIAYSYFKNLLSDGNEYIPCRIGDINRETKFVLNYFEVSEPINISNVRTQVKDINIKKVSIVTPDISLKRAWEVMKRESITTLPVSLDGKKLIGLITVGDIARSYMDIYDDFTITEAGTSYKNILEVIEGKMIAGNENMYLKEGHVLVGAMNPDIMENYIKKGDIVILGNRYESQLCAIEMGAQCLIITGGVPVSTSIKKLAENNNCTIIISPHDTYTVARLINQSIPIRHFMKTSDLTVFTVDDSIDEVKEIMVNKRYRNFPVVDSDNNIVGMISRASLINMKRKQIILVDHNERTQSVEGLEEAEILEIIDHHRIGDIQTSSPVYFRNHPLGCTATIIANIYKENNIEIPKHIAGILCAAILSDTLIFKSPTCTIVDRRMAEYLSQTAEINIKDFARDMFRAGSDLFGKSDEEIFFQDFKQFKIGDFELGVGQINSMDASELDDIKHKIFPYMKKIFADKSLNAILFMLTDIINESTELLYVGDVKDILMKAFDVPVGENSIILPGVVSRKKQIIPPILNSILGN